MTEIQRPDWDTYYMQIAHTVAARSSCIRRNVGAIVVIDHGIVCTGYNGTPFGIRNCNEGGCARCASTTPRQASYDLCICVHAEQNVIAEAARRGIMIRGGTLYTTYRPCLGCLKELIQVGVEKIMYDDSFLYQDHDVEAIYQDLLRQSGVITGQVAGR